MLEIFARQIFRRYAPHIIIWFLRDKNKSLTILLYVSDKMKEIDLEKTLAGYLYIHSAEAIRQMYSGKLDISALEIIVARGFANQIVEGNYSENHKKYAKEMLEYLSKLSQSIVQLALISSIEKSQRKFTGYEYLDLHQRYKRFS